MAKELPYFQFEPAEYLTKDISFCSLELQGLFISVCSYYWQRSCQLTKTQILKRLNYPEQLDQLINEGVIDCDKDVIKIKFLDIQLINATKTSSANSKNGSLGGAKKGNKNAKKQAKNNPKTSEKQGIREDKIIEEEIKEKDIPTEAVFIAYAFKQGKRVGLDLDLIKVKLKYNSWIENDWKTGGDIPKQIRSWKVTLNNTLVYLKKDVRPEDKPFKYEY